jgi:anti-sigma factor RsiW
VSHLGRRLSALIDGELGDSEREQAHAHLVGCDACRAEAASLRMLKRRIGGLGETRADSELTRRLIALGGLPDPATPATPAAPIASATPASRTRPALAALSGAGSVGTPWDTPSPWLNEELEVSPELLSPVSRGHARGHTRFMVAGAVAALAVSLGGVSFAAGGERGGGPTVNPDVELYSAQQAVDTGQLPVFSPEAYLSARPVGVRTLP